MYKVNYKKLISLKKGQCKQKIKTDINNKQFKIVNNRKNRIFVIQLLYILNIFQYSLAFSKSFVETKKTKKSDKR